MSLYVDHKYFNILSSRLIKFTRKSRELYNFRCPICGDSKKNKYKARGYAYVKEDMLLFKCHNCNASGNLKTLLEKLDPILAKQYNFENYTSKYTKRHTEQAKVPLFVKPKFKKVDLENLLNLEEDHPALRYVRARQIPKIRYHDLYFTDCFKSWVTKYDVELASRLKIDDPRIIIPFFDKDKNLIAAQGRSIENNTLRYFTIKIDKTALKIYGLDRWDKAQPAYITEGPFDSMFLPNSMAMAGSDLDDINQFIGTKLIFIYDNEQRNKEILNKMLKVILKGFNIVIWPDNIEFKDINDMIVGGISLDDLMVIINKNTFVGLQARLKLNQWKKI